MEQSHSLLFLNFVLLPAIGVVAVVLTFRMLTSIYNRRLGRASDIRAEVKRYLVMLALCLAAALLLVVVFEIIPNKLHGAAPNSLEQSCAIEAGYLSPSDSSSPRATAESKSIYTRCLEAQ